jgi:hypothetical protein
VEEIGEEIREVACRLTTGLDKRTEKLCKKNK